MQMRLMHGSGLGQQNHQAGPVQSFDVRHLHRDHSSAQLLGSMGRVQNSRFHLRSDRVEIEILRQPNSDLANRRRPWLAAIEIGHGVQRDADVVNRPRQRSHVIQTQAQWLDSGAVD